MPSFKIIDQDSGRAITVTGDSAPTEAEITRLFDQEDKKSNPFLKELAAEQGPVDAFFIGAGRGLTNVARGLGLVKPEAEIGTEAFAELQEQRPIATGAGEIIGEAAPFLAPGLGVGSIAGTGARIAGGAALGALEGSVISRGRGGTTEEQLISGGAGGIIAGGAEALFPVLGRLGGSLVRKVTGKKAVGALLDAAGNPTAELKKALKETGVSFDDLTDAAKELLDTSSANPNQAARKAFLESQGIIPTKAQVTREAVDFQAQQEAIKTSGRVRTAIETQEAVLSDAFDTTIKGTGGDAVTSGSPVSDFITNRSVDLDKKISGLYKIARGIAPGEKNVKLSALGDKLRKLAPDNEITKGAVASIVGDLKTRGIMDDNFKIVGKIDVETAEEIRKKANSLFSSTSAFGRGAIREMKDALDEDVLRVAGKDVFQEARKAKSVFEKELSRGKISKFDKRRGKGLLRDILENQVDPDNFSKQTVFSKKYRASDLQELKEFLRAGTPTQKAAGRKAFDDLRAEVLTEIKEKSFIGPVDEKGFRALSMDKLQKQLQTLGNQKMNILFSQKERKFLDDMLNVSRLREPVRATQQGRGPTAQAVGRIEQKLKEIPIFGSLVDFIEIDAGGRSALRAIPQKVIPAPGKLSKELSGAASAAVIPLTAQGDE